MTLWGDPDDDMLSLQRKPRRTPGANIFVHLFESCNFYGHSWEYFGITGLKKCAVCHAMAIAQDVPLSRHCQMRSLSSVRHIRQKVSHYDKERTTTTKA